jgi:hypothetical protein
LKSKEPKQPREKKARARKSGEETRFSVQKGAEAEVISRAGAANGSSTHSPNGALTHDLELTSARTAEMGPPEEMVRVRAYELFVARGYEHGHHMEDWLAAERELKIKHRAPA